MTMKLMFDGISIGSLVSVIHNYCIKNINIGNLKQIIPVEEL